ncbi:hypothetical protein AUJ46_02765 [Candidatus Peregrinibacteria bacterium CG1_02_54_53]|nr:MAG: hypothetical protein AUJ46_02765 [Candidatus Peregrinibacteria bacterium CG1_02_54_53]
MPTYDFRCLKCSHVFEAVLSFGGKQRPACPACKNAKTEKLIAPPAIHFKGTGFFKTDSRKPSPKKSAESPVEKSTDTPAKKSTEPVADKSKDPPSTTDKKNP